MNDEVSPPQLKHPNSMEVYYGNRFSQSKYYF